MSDKNNKFLKLLSEKLKDYPKQLIGLGIILFSIFLSQVINEIYKTIICFIVLIILYSWVLYFTSKAEKKKKKIIFPILVTVVLGLFVGLILKKNLHPFEESKDIVNNRDTLLKDLDTIVRHKANNMIYQNCDSILTKRPETLLDFFLIETCETFPEYGIDTSQYTPSNDRFDTSIKLDFTAKTMSLRYFIYLQQNTYELCKAIASTIQEDIDYFRKNIKAESVNLKTGNTIYDIDDLVFDNHVIIYHEYYMFKDQLDSLSAIFDKQNVTVEFRGQNYLDMKLKELK